MSDQASIEAARTFLELADVFYYSRKDLEEARREPQYPEHAADIESSLQQLNMNDVWGWALAYGVDVTDEELPELARLYRAYGYCGVLYWVAEKDGWERSEFEDITRFVQFVREEERIRKEVPGSSARAYAKRGYVVGVLPPKPESPASKLWCWMAAKGWFKS